MNGTGRNRFTLLLAAVAIALAAIGVTQYIELRRQADRLANLKEEILAELRTPAEPGNAMVARAPGTPHAAGGAAATPRPATPPPEPPPPPKALTETQYWISTDTSDGHPEGWSAWLELVKNGHLIIEHCRAPDYSAPANNDRIPFRRPTCDTRLDTRIRELSDRDVTLADGSTLPLRLEDSRGSERVTLTLDGKPVVLAPGQKNTLWQGLMALPSVQAASRAAWESHSR